MEVAWQRLSEEQKVPELAHHWSRFGNIETPKHKKILVADDFDVWRGGLEDVHLRLGDWRSEIQENLFSSDLKLRRIAYYSLPYRVKLRLRSEAW